MFYQTNRTQAAQRAEKCRFCPWWPWLLTLTFKLVRVFMWIWRKSVQRFPRYFIYKQKIPQTDGAKKTVPSAVHCVR